MSFFDDASLAFLPSGAAGKDGKAYSIKPTDGTGDFTFSRGSNLAATRVGADGLIEKGRENLLLQSNQFDTTWATSGTLTSGQTGYDGSSDAWLFESPSTFMSIAQGVSISGVQTYSVYAKAGTTDWLQLRLVGSSTIYANFDLNPSTTGSRIGAKTGQIDASIEDVGNGWFRCSLLADIATSAARIYIARNNSTTINVGDNIYIQDAQLEIGLAATDVIESGATTGKAGLLEDEPRFDYSGGATCGSLLLEPSRTNLFTQSEYITNAIRATITHNQAISPEGLQNAFLVVDSTDLNNHQFATGAPSLFNFGGTDTVVFSVFAKKQNNRYINLRINDNAANVGGTLNYYNATFDLEGGVVTADFEYGTPTSPFSDIEDYGNGWFRCWVGLTKKSGVTRTDVSGYLVNSSAAIDNPAYAGTGNDGNYLYGFQIEAGSYPTSYIPNHSGGSVTRGADDVNRLTGVGVTGDEFTIFLELDLSDTPLVANPGTYFQTFDASNNSQQEFRFFNWADEQVLVPYFRPDTTYPFGNGSNPVRFDGKILFRSDGGGSYTMFFGFNGSSTKEVRTGLTAYTLNKVDFVSQPKTNVKQLLIFNEALSDEDCTTLTT